MRFRPSFCRFLLLPIVLLLTLNCTAQGQVYPLDRIGLSATNASVPAYSLRLLSSAYPGKAVTVRRSSDDATQDIGFTAAGDLDTMTLLAFVGSGSGYVSRWYDQGGAGIDATQASLPLQPRLVNAGVIERLNGRPALYFGSSNLATAAQVLFANGASLVAVAWGNGPTPAALATKSGLANGTNPNYPAPFDFVNTEGNFVIGSASNTNTPTFQPLAGSAVESAVPTSVYSFVIAPASSVFSAYRNGTVLASGPIAAYQDGGAPLRIGNRNDGGSSGNFWTPELVFFNGALPDADRTAAEDAQKTYYTPIPCPDIAISTQPRSDSICSGSTATLSVQAPGATGYQWLREGVPVGGNSASLLLPGFSDADAGNYTCRVYNACRSISSTTARLVTFGAPSAYPRPEVAGSRAICEGASATLTAIGPAGRGFRWYATANAQTPLFEGAVFTTPALSASVSYFVAAVICNAEGPRQEVFVRVSPPVTLPGAGPVATPASICSGTSQLSAQTDTGNGQVVYWYDAPTGGNLLGVTESGASLPVSPSVTTTYYAETGPRKSKATFMYTRSVQSFTVPAGVSELQVEAYGARGGGSLGGGGGCVRATLAVTPGQVLGIYVGQQGIAPNYINTSAAPAFGGGGGGSYYQQGGGGASDIRSTPGGTLYDRLLVAGGGGGGYKEFHSGGSGYTLFQGGLGGGLVGGSAYPVSGVGSEFAGSTGGTQTAGGNAFGGFGTGASGGYGTANGAGFRGGGGGGWYGGGGGATYGGGGGSSYTNPYLCTGVTHTQGICYGDGIVVLTYSAYSTCVGEQRRPVTVTVRQHPTVTVTPDQYSCPGSPVTLTAAGADNYQWQPGSLTGASIVVTPGTNTVYTVVGSYNNSNCGDTAQSIVTTSFQGRATDTVCAGGVTSVTLNDVPPGATVRWYTGPAGSGSLVGTGTSISGLAAGTYYARFALPCGIVDAAPLTVFTSGDVPVTIYGDSLLCPGTSTFLSATYFGALSWGARPLPVDAAPAAAKVAVGPRLLNSSYTGPLLRLRRSSDGAQQNFGALGNNLDTAAVRSWLAGAVGYCVTLFDQSGTGNDITQDSVWAQPELLLQNAVSRQPVLRFTSNQFMQLDAAFPQPFTISVTARLTGAARERVLASYRNNWLLGWHGGRQGRAFFEGWVAQNGSEANNSFQVYTGTSDGVTGSLYENGSLLSANGGGVAGPDGLQLNGWGGSEYSDCEIAELLVFGTVLPNEARTAVESGAHNYYAAPDRLLVPAPEYGAPKTYTATAGSAGCGTSRTASVTVRSAAGGAPALFGSDAWNVSVWQKGGAFASAWTSGFSGFYVDSSVSLNTAARWAAASAPSSAAGYTGCAVPATAHSWSAKRKGFPCAWYRIDVNGHDAAQLWVNGVKVWEHEGCCDSHAAVWAGALGAADSVEFRASRNGSQSASALTLTPITATLSYSPDRFCVSGTGTATVSIPGGTFSASPSGLLLNPVTGVITGGTPGQYLVTYTVAAGCLGTVSATAAFEVKQPLGDPSVFGTDGWKVYVWNSGGSTIPNSNSWNANYVGSFPAPVLDFNTTDYWPSNGRPSDAPGYSGCEAVDYQYTWSAKRKGFPCGRYQVSIPSHRYTGQLWINGVMVWEHRGYGDYHGNVWTGTLGPTDSVEFRCLNGGSASYGRIAFTPLGYSVELSYPVSNSCTTSVPVAASVNYSGGVFSSLPAGLALDAATGTITPTASSSGDYTIYYTWISPCGDTLVDSAYLSIGTQQGDPSVFGAGEWRVHVWNSGGASIAPNCWSTNYSGYYTATGTDFSTLNQWADGAAPSSAPGYTGCAVGTDNHSWSAKRKGFPCGYYSLNVDSHDDAAQLWINGVKVWEHNACCDSHVNAWEGMLGASDSVEFRVTQGTGGAQGSLSFHLSVPTFGYPSSPYCTSAGLLAPSRQLSGGVFSASPAGLSINAATGVVNTAASFGGTYTVSYTYITGCGDTLLGTAPITIIAPGGDPTVAGNNAWNVYAWNAGDLNNPQQSWNTNYVGYIPAAQTGQTMALTYFNGLYPSSSAAFQGCPITSNSFSYTAVRKGFTCGNYELRLTTLDGTGQLWVNGSLVRSFGRFEASNAVVWRGYLSVADVVEIRMRSIPGFGSRLRLTLTAVTQTASLTYPATAGCYVAGSSETVMPLTTGIAGGTFSATPAGLVLNSSTGAISLATSVAGDYTITYSGTSVCGTALSASKTLSVVAPAGDPAIYGSNQWNVYAWNAGNQSGTPWTTAYAGYYVEPALSFNSGDRWDPFASPSSASGYQGCAVGNDNHSWSAKRKGFPCGYYTLDIPGHDDNVELRINGVLVFAHTDCCDAHSTVWEGVLGSEDAIEFRVSEGDGGSMGQLTLSLHPTITASIWTGAVDRDWTNAANWCGAVPTATTDVRVPVAANEPVVYSGAAATVRNLTVQSGTSLTVQGTMNLYGNLVNSGGTLDISSGRLDLEGATRQTVPPFAVGDLHVNGGGGFELAGISTVSGTLLFAAAGGHVILGSNDLTVGNISGGDAGAFIVTNGSGALKRKALTGTQLLPVGISTGSYTPLTITNTEGLDWSVRLQDGFAGYPALNQSAALPRLWHITPSVSPTTQPVSLVFSYPDSLWATPSLLSVFHYTTTGGWALANNSASGLQALLSGGLRSVALPGQQHFSPFAITGTSSPLPVTWLHFSGRAEEHHNVLEWRTATEQNNRGFSVERSYDGARFSAIGFVASAAANGNTATVQSYHYADSSYTGLQQYYRLRQVDIDGHSRYSSVVLLRRGDGNVVRMLVYPNPAGAEVTVQVVVPAAVACTLRVTDATGRTVRSQEGMLRAGDNRMHLPLSGLAQGSYWLEVRDASGLLLGSGQLLKK